MKSSNGTLVGLNYLRFNHDGLLHAYCSRLAPLLMMFGATSSVKVAIVDVSDGEECGPGIVGYCSRSADAILVPDIEFYYSRGYAKFLQEPHSENRDWATREETLVWRGSTTGAGRAFARGDESRDVTTRYFRELGMCLLLRNHPGTDVRLSKVVHSGNTAMEENRFARRTFLALALRVQIGGVGIRIDIDGTVYAWSKFYSPLNGMLRNQGCFGSGLSSVVSRRANGLGALRSSSARHVRPARESGLVSIKQFGMPRNAARAKSSRGANFRNRDPASRTTDRRCVEDSTTLSRSLHNHDFRET